MKAAVSVLVVAAATALAPAPRAASQTAAESREVRQLVTFRFLPGQTRAVLDLYRDSLMPAYREVEAIDHVRAFGEVESPEPLDLMIVTHYADMAAMDRANATLARRPPDQPAIGALYRQISDLSLGHTDQFVEVLSSPNFADPSDRTLEVLEFLRVNPLMAPAFERQTLDAVHAWEQEQGIRQLVPRTETARFLVADGWDYLRTYAVRSLGGWQAYVTARGRHPAAAALSRMVEARKTLILREMPDLRVR